MQDLLKRDLISEIPWQVEQLRCTAFLLPLFDASAEGVFQVIAGSDPFEVRENRQQAVETATGSLDEFKLDVVKAPARIDIVLHSRDDSTASPSLTLLGPWLEVITAFSSRVQGWLGSQPRLQRLALGATVLNEVTDRLTGYKILNQLLPKVDIDVEHSSDFFFQINRPRLVAVGQGPSIEVNRLSKWSFITVITRRFIVSTNELTQRPMNLVASMRNYCRAELDVNTDEKILELPVAQVESIWVKLVEFAREILLKGDVP
jgi:hypothetical protein